MESETLLCKTTLYALNKTTFSVVKSRTEGSSLEETYVAVTLAAGSNLNFDMNKHGDICGVSSAENLHLHDDSGYWK